MLTTRRPQTDRDLACHDRRDEACAKVAELVVVVACAVDHLTEPAANRHFGIGVVSADHQDHSVYEDEHVNKRRQRKSFACEIQHRQGNEHRQHFRGAM